MKKKHFQNYFMTALNQKKISKLFHDSGRKASWTFWNEAEMKRERKLKSQKVNSSLDRVQKANELNGVLPFMNDDVPLLGQAKRHGCFSSNWSQKANVLLSWAPFPFIRKCYLKKASELIFLFWIWGSNHSPAPWIQDLFIMIWESRLNGVELCKW